MIICHRPRCDRKAKQGQELCHRHLYAEGIFKRRVPIAPVRAHLQDCIAQGATLNGIATATGVHPVTTYQAAGHRAHYENQTGIAQDVAAKLMRATPDMVGHLPAWPYTRRVQALRAAGHNLATIATECGLSVCGVSDMSNGKYSQVTPDTAEGIRDGYDRMSMWTTGTIQTQTLARGWAPPMVWDDIDDPDEDHTIPDGTVQVAGAVLAAAMELYAHYRMDDVGEKVGVSCSLIQAFMQGKRTHTTMRTAQAILKADSTLRKQQAEPVAA